MNLRRIAASLLLLTLAACGHKPPAAPEPPPPPRPIVKKIGFLPVHELTSVSFENKNFGLTFLFPIAAAGISSSNKSKQPVFSTQFLALKPTLGKQLMDSVTRELEQEGFEVVVLQDVPRPPKDPEKIDLDKIKADADAILHVYFDEIGLYSTNLSPDYLPRINVRAALQSTKIDDELYGEKLCWGIDAQPGEGWAIQADRKIAYNTFDIVMTQLPDIANQFEGATQALAKRMVTRMKAELNRP